MSVCSLTTSFRPLTGLVVYSLAIHLSCVHSEHFLDTQKRSYNLFRTTEGRLCRELLNDTYHKTLCSKLSVCSPYMATLLRTGGLLTPMIWPKHILCKETNTVFTEYPIKLCL